jgi:hypothetical protein
VANLQEAEHDAGLCDSLNGKQASAIWAGVRGSRRASRTCAFCECARQQVGAGRTLGALAFAQLRAHRSAPARPVIGWAPTLDPLVLLSGIASRRSLALSRERTSYAAGQMRHQPILSGREPGGPDSGARIWANSKARRGVGRDLGRRDRYVAEALVRRSGARLWKRSCGPRQPDARVWAIASVAFADIAGAGRATRAYAQVEHQRAVQRFWIRRKACAPQGDSAIVKAKARRASSAPISAVMKHPVGVAPAADPVAAGAH